MCVYVYVCIYADVYMYIHKVHIHTYIHTFIHTFIQHTGFATLPVRNSQACLKELDRLSSLPHIKGVILGTPGKCMHIHIHYTYTHTHTHTHIHTYN